MGAIASQMTGCVAGTFCTAYRTPRVSGQMVGGRWGWVKFSQFLASSPFPIFDEPPTQPNEGNKPGCAASATPANLRHLHSMDLEQFRNFLASDRPPKELSLPLAALWWDAKGDWGKAHESAQQDEGPGGAWVHAYLHRKEGDLSNAGYWYSRTGKPQARMSLDQEWSEIVNALANENR
jgi:hypothetical protein